MCTLYSITTNQDAINALFRVTRDAAGIFRFSICATMHALRWIAVGGAKKVGKDRIRNDIIDASIAAQALCFDGLLSKDAMAQEIYSNSLFMLNQFLNFVPKQHSAAAAVNTHGGYKS
jgi:hypothetical protein